MAIGGLGIVRAGFCAWAGVVFGAPMAGMVIGAAVAGMAMSAAGGVMAGGNLRELAGVAMALSGIDGKFREIAGMAGADGNWRALAGSSGK